MKFTKYIFGIVLLLVYSGLKAQDSKVVSDFRLYSSLGLEKKFFDQLELGIKSTLKLEEDASRIEEVNLDLSIDYAPFKFMWIGCGYRIAANQTSDESYITRNRINADLGLKTKIERWGLKYRIRYQNIADDYFPGSDSVPSKQILRNRIEVKHNIRKSKISPFVYAELYGSFEAKNAFATTMKTALGVRYAINKQNRIKIMYRIDRQLNDPNPYTYNTLNIGYTFRF